MECLSSLSALLSPASSGFNSTANTGPVDLLCLGSGWTWTFLGPLAGETGLRTAFTTRAGTQGSLPFAFDPESPDPAQFEGLPDATTILIVFPIYTEKGVKNLVKGYLDSRKAPEDGGEAKVWPRFIQLGSTGIWDNGPTFAPLAPLTAGSVDGKAAPRLDKPPSYDLLGIARSSPDVSPSPSSVWKDRHSPVAPLPRAKAEEYLLALNKANNAVSSRPIETSVLNLSGLWGHGRSPRRYIGAIAPSKEALARLGSVHLVHGRDVARAVLAMHRLWERSAGQRWILTNERVYDLWELCSRWGNAGEDGRNHPPVGPQAGWVQELIAESRSASLLDFGDKKSKPKHPVPTPERIVRGLPRTPEQMGSALDGTEFWTTFGITPDVPWVD